MTSSWCSIFCCATFVTGCSPLCNRCWFLPCGSFYCVDVAVAVSVFMLYCVLPPSLVQLLLWVKNEVFSIVWRSPLYNFVVCCSLLCSFCCVLFCVVFAMWWFLLHRFCCVLWCAVFAVLLLCCFQWVVISAAQLLLSIILVFCFLFFCRLCWGALAMWVYCVKFCVVALAVWCSLLCGFHHAVVVWLLLYCSSAV